MKYLLLVCWDAQNMDAQTEPDPTDTPDEESFPGLTTSRRGHVGQRRPVGSAAPGPLRPRPRREGDRHRRSVRRDQGGGGGFDIIECGSPEEAVETAAARPIAQTGAIEVRPLWGN
jgi:hypothetical protein